MGLLTNFEYIGQNLTDFYKIDKNWKKILGSTFFSEIIH